MYVMSKKWDSITNIAQCTSVYVSPEHEIKAVPTGGGAGVYCPDRGRIAHGGLVLGCESHGGPEGQKCKGGHMKAHLAFLCNGRCQWCKNYWDCSKTKRLLAKILGCKDWRWQNR